MSQGGPLVGKKGVKYGLQLPKAQQRRPAVANAKLNVFGDDSDEDDVGAQVARQAGRKQSDAKVRTRNHDPPCGMIHLQTLMFLDADAFAHGVAR
jgi:hypothetical protein